MPVPTTPIPNWANDAAFTTGIETGLAPTTPFTAGEILQGMKPGKVVARKLNWLFRTITQWLSWFEESRPNFSTGSTHAMTGTCQVTGGTLRWIGPLELGGTLIENVVVYNPTAEINPLDCSHQLIVINNATGAYPFRMPTVVSSTIGQTVTLVNLGSSYEHRVLTSGGALLGILQRGRTLTLKLPTSSGWIAMCDSSPLVVPETHVAQNGVIYFIAPGGAESHVFTGAQTELTYAAVDNRYGYEGQRKEIKNSSGFTIMISDTDDGTSVTHDLLELPPRSTGYVYYYANAWH